MDFGHGALYQRCRAEGDINAAVDSVEHLFLSHSHPDHIIDITRYAIAWKYTPGFSPGKPVYLYGTEITLNAVKTMLDNVGLEGYYEEIFIPQPVLVGTPIRIGTLEALPFPANHIDGAIGLRLITGAGVEVAYTGDTAPFDNQADSVKGTDLLVAEASFRSDENIMHLNLLQAAQLASDTDARALLITHFYPDVENQPPDVIRETISKTYNGRIHIARDGLALQWDESSRSWNEGTIFQ